MIKYLIIVFLVIAAAACNSNKSNEENIPVDTVKVFTRADSLDGLELPKERINNLPLLVDIEKQTVIKNPVAIPVVGNVDSVISLLNAYYPTIKLEKIKLGHDTLYTVIKDSEYLGERMGTTGASEYVANAILNLTSVPGIKYIKIDMDEHSHSSPGIFSRKDYSDFKIIK